MKIISDKLVLMISLTTFVLSVTLLETWLLFAHEPAVKSAVTLTIGGYPDSNPSLATEVN